MQILSRAALPILVGLMAVSWATEAAAQRTAVARPQPPPAGDKPREAPRDTKPPKSAEYRLVPGDKLRIEVYKDPQLSQSLQVRPDGKITMPLLGDLDAAERTSIELRDTITAALKEYMTNPVVTVIVVETQALHVYVMGEVNHPGALPIQTSLTVLQAIALAGGVKDFADTKNIRILRSGPAGTQTISFNYKEALRGIGAPIYLRPGDMVVVPD
jgi:polysaccharide export outer membrane protein